jgi:putative colanic acid biosynthesis UDP-glucose lipid carrier transferase
MKRNSSLNGFILLFTDFAALNLIESLLPHGTDPFYSQIIIISNLTWLLARYIADYYARNKNTWSGRLIKAAASGYSLLLLFNWGLYAAGKHQQQYGNYLLIALLIFGFYLLISRVVLVGVQRLMTAYHQVHRKIIIIGSNETAAHLLRQFESDGIIYSLAGIFTDKKSVSSLEEYVKGNISEAIDFALEQQVKEIYTTISPEENNRLYKIAESAERNFIQFKLVPDISHFLCRKPNTDQDIELPILCLTPEPEADLPGQIQKRAFDVLFSAFVIIFILSWLAPVLAFLIKLESSGPVFFKQLRTGKNGRPFLCFKFRSLQINNEADSKQVTTNDSRFTSIGRFMRKTNLDELPQFLNVLLGDMSVVGSRPHMLKHTEDYSRLYSRYMTRHYIKPGLTGWAQVNGYRGEIKVEEQLIKRVEHDIWYMENWNFWLDMRIVLQTLSSTFKGDKNAY